MIIMNLILQLLLQTAQAQLTTEILLQSKDWTAVKEFSTDLDSNVCMATTNLVDQTSGLPSELRVVKLINADGSYSLPFVFITSQSVSVPFYKGQLKISSKSLSLNLLQTKATNGLITKYAENEKIIDALKAGNSAKVDFQAKSTLLNLEFSLSGSSKVINAMESACK